MLKKRIIGVVIVKDQINVQSIEFKKYLPIGSPAISVEYLNDWGIDEIILLDISASKKGKKPDFEKILSLSKYCGVPLCVGGGIKEIDDISKLMDCGADKISLNHSFSNDMKFIENAAKRFGSQCIVASMDILNHRGEYKMYDYFNNKSTNQSPIQTAKKYEEIGVGEIFLNSVNQDGTYQGFDLKPISDISDAVNIPVIACGGAGKANDFINVFNNTNAAAAAAGNFFNFYEHSVTIVKEAIQREIKIRHETHYKYSNHLLDDQNRLLKKSDAFLEELIFVKIEKEII
jgi:imidazole glycerol-phosphate synthase subunit HisF